jgi:hypothetical protein
MGPSYGLRLDGDELVCERSDDGYELLERVTMEPSPDAWPMFWRTQDDLEVWAWAPRYEDRRVLDGTQWSVELGDAAARSRPAARTLTRRGSSGSCTHRRREVVVDTSSPGAPPQLRRVLEFLGALARREAATAPAATE